MCLTWRRSSIELCRELDKGGCSDTGMSLHVQHSLQNEDRERFDYAVIYRSYYFKIDALRLRRHSPSFAHALLPKLLHRRMT